MRAADRGAALGADIGDIAGTSLDKGVELDALASILVSSIRIDNAPSKQTEQAEE